VAKFVPHIVIQEPGCIVLTELFKPTTPPLFIVGEAGSTVQELLQGVTPVAASHAGSLDGVR
jgi:hypothetical protein